MKKRSLTSILSAVVISAVVLSSCGRTDNKMTYRINHNTGDRVSLLGFGCMRFTMVEDENGNRVVDQELVNKLIDKALANGVNFFDNAPMYLQGQNEIAVGRALVRHRHNRSNFFVTSKMSNFRDFSFEAGKAMYLKSLEDLQVDYIDYYFLHSVGSGGLDRFNERFIDNGLLDFLLAEREAGRIRNLGWSFHGDVAVFDAMFEMGVHWDFAMIQMNYMDWQHASGRNVNAEYLYNKLVKHNIPVITMSSLRGGQLSTLGPLATEVLERVTPGRTPSEWGFRYLGSFDGILTILTGMNTIEQLEENIRTFSPMKPLSPEEYDAIKEVARIMNTAGFINCTACGYCLPCPFDVDIVDVLIEYNRHITEGRSIDPNNQIFRQAALCTDCVLCEHKCPQNLRIVRELKRIDSFVRAAR